MARSCAISWLSDSVPRADRRTDPVRVRRRSQPQPGAYFSPVRSLAASSQTPWTSGGARLEKAGLGREHRRRPCIGGRSGLPSAFSCEPGPWVGSTRRPAGARALSSFRCARCAGLSERILRVGARELRRVGRCLRPVVPGGRQESFGAAIIDRTQRRVAPSCLRVRDRRRSVRCSVRSPARPRCLLRSLVVSIG